MTRRYAVTVFVVVLLPVCAAVTGLVWAASPRLALLSGGAVMVEGLALMAVVEIAARRHRAERQRSNESLAALDALYPPPAAPSRGPHPERWDF